MSRKLLFPDDLRRLVRQRYERQHRSWIAGAGEWPLSIALGEVTEREVSEDAALIRRWVEAWQGWRPGEQVDWEDRRWPRLGVQRLPVRIQLSCGEEVAVVADELVNWQRSRDRFDVFATRWPQLRTTPAFARLIDTLNEYAPADFERLVALITWLEHNPCSGHYLRQLPVPGLDTKWIDSRRRGVVVDILRAIRDLAGGTDFHHLCGLRQPPHRIRVRLLCPDLRAALAGLGDFEAPLQELVALRTRPERIIIVENLETGIALPEIAGAIAFMKLGMGVSVLSQLAFVRNLPVLYWGDIDTHGFVILDRVRAMFPTARSILMDEATLLANRPLWGREAQPHRQIELPHLTSAERLLTGQLHSHTWGDSIRLEQERIPWRDAVFAIDQAVRELAR